MTNPPESCKLQQTTVRQPDRQREGERAWRQMWTELAAKIKSFCAQGKNAAKNYKFRWNVNVIARLISIGSAADAAASQPECPAGKHCKKLGGKHIGILFYYLMCFSQCSKQRHLGICLPATELPSNDGQKHLVGVSLQQPPPPPSLPQTAQLAKRQSNKPSNHSGTAKSATKTAVAAGKLNCRNYFMSNARFGKQFVTFEWTLNDNCGPAFWPGFLIRFRHGAHTHTESH